MARDTPPLGITLLLIYNAHVGRYGKLPSIASWLSLIGMLLAIATVNPYMLANPPGEHSPNPHSNAWLSLPVEPALAIMPLGVALSYATSLIGTIFRGSRRQGAHASAMAAPRDLVGQGRFARVGRPAGGLRPD